MVAKTRLGVFCDKLIEAGWLAALVIVPLFFNVYSSRVFEPDKITTLRSIAIVMVAAWLVKTAENTFWGTKQQISLSGMLRDVWQGITGVPLVMPVLALIAVYLVSTVFSVTPRVSLLGSYQRLQGTYSTFSYIIVFFMMLQGLRTREQVERVITVVVLTSIPIALYGIIQHYGLDPLPWGGDVRTRVAGNMGNAIFIAAYLIMAIPLALYRTVESFTEILTAEESRFVDVLLGASYIFVVAIQAICIFFTQSRGPWLGLIGGLFFFFLVLAVVRRWRWLVWASVASVLAVTAFLVIFNLPNTPLEPLRSIPYIGRLGRALDKEQTTSKVRLLIWEGAIDMVLPHRPLERPDGARDWMNPLRPFVGYGPESMYVAYNRFYPPDLAHYEKRNASPDRSHNETFDSLVITGVVGFLAYMFVFAGVFFYGFRWLGIIANAAQRNLFVGCWVGGGIAGAAVMVLWQGDEFFGVGLPAGIAGGLGLYLVIWGLFLSQRVDAETSESRERNPYNLLVVALVSAILAHFVEIHFGIAIGATRTYFWAYTGLMVVVGYLIPRQLELEQENARRQAEEVKPSGSRRRRRRRRSISGSRQWGTTMLPGLASVVPYALILALVLATLAFDFVSNNQQGLVTPQEIVVAALAKRPEGGELVPSYGILGIVGITCLLGSAIIVAEWIRRGGQGDWRGPLGACLALSFVVGFVFAMIMAGRLVSTQRQTQLLDQARMIMGMLSTYYVLVFILMPATGLVLMWEVRSPRASGQSTGTWLYSFLLVVVVLIAAIWVVLGTNLKVVHADMVYKQAQPYERQQLWDFSIILHQEAIKLAPQEDFYHLFLGRAFLEKAKSANPAADRLPRTFTMSDILRLTPEQLADLSRGDLLNASETALLRAREINPLNTDHSANLGRLFRTRAESASDSVNRYEYFQRSIAHYAEATSLSPNAAHLYDEWGVVYLAMGEQEKAIERYEYSLEIDDRFDMTYMSLGDAYMRANDLEKAKEAYLRAVEINPRLADVHSVLAYIYGTQEDYASAIAETNLVLELTKNQRQQYTSYKNLAVYYQQLGQMQEAVTAAQNALALAPENEQDSLRTWIAQMTEGDAAPETERLVQQFLSEGEVALNNKQWTVAEQAYLKALNLNPNLVVAHSALAFLYAQLGRLDEAESENLIVLSAVPDDYATIKNLAIIYRELKRYDEALSYARRALESPQATPEDRGQWQTFISDIETKAGG
jgi:tetratricopeptide (TPR) repeat protein/O-antigen ligase